MWKQSLQNKLFELIKGQNKCFPNHLIKNSEILLINILSASIFMTTQNALPTIQLKQQRTKDI